MFGAAVCRRYQPVSASGCGTDAGHTPLRSCRSDGSEGSWPLDHCVRQSTPKLGADLRGDRRVIGGYPGSACAPSRMPPIPVSAKLR